MLEPLHLLFCLLLTCCALVLRDCSSSAACCFSVSFTSASVKFTSDTFCTHTWMYFLPGHRAVTDHTCVVDDAVFIVDVNVISLGAGVRAETHSPVTSRKQ